MLCTGGMHLDNYQKKIMAVLEARGKVIATQYNYLQLQTLALQVVFDSILFQYTLYIYYDCLLQFHSIFGKANPNTSSLLSTLSCCLLY
jgi:hypothetical protein